MRKLFILLLIPSMVMGQTCFIHEGKNKYSKLQACNDGDQLYFYVSKLVLKDEKEINRIVSTTKNSFCDLSYKINHISLKARVVCINLAEILPENSLL